MKFYFLHMNPNEVGTPLKHPKTINGNVKNLSKRMKMKNKGNANFYFENLTLPLLANKNPKTSVNFHNFFLAGRYFECAMIYFHIFSTGWRTLGVPKIRVCRTHSA